MKEQTKRPWGEYKVIKKTKIISVKPNSKLSLQYHNKREEFWKILSGEGIIIIGNKEINVKKGDSFTIPKKIKHRVITKDKELVFLEVATGEVYEDDIVRLEDEYDRNKEKVVVASGYFDPLHIGHIEYLELAKKLGTKLIVIINNDEQTKAKKGFIFMPQKERSKIIKSLKFVDEVFISIDKDSSVCKSIEAIKPNIFAKGGDRFSHEIPEAKICKKYGIEIIDSLGKKIQSSSKLIGKLKK